MITQSMYYPSPMLLDFGDEMGKWQDAVLQRLSKALLEFCSEAAEV
jgi:hypothetical protein